MNDANNDLTELVKAYVAAEPNRARGGIVALSGFEYQIWSYLADFALALSSSDLLVGGSQFVYAFETLSDYTRRSETGTICVQVKHHLDRRNMELAGAEFASIERFLESHATINLRDSIRYEVVARTGSASLDWATIQLPLKIRVHDPELIGYFDRLRDGGRLHTPRFEPDPHWKLVAAVFPHLVNPFGFARRAFELCMRRTRDPASAAFVRETIAEDYAANIRKRTQASRPLSESDFCRDPNGSGISLARTPTLCDLRNNRFMERSKRLADVLSALDDIRDSVRDYSEPIIQVLWIDGRSGCGKSVLLLHILEHLVVEDQASLIWFANGTEDVSAIIEQMAETDTYLRPDFLVVDDIYDPQARDDLDLPRLTRLVVHSDVTTWPILITCGPTEFRQDFERDCRAEGFRVNPWHLSTLEPVETEALRTWFQFRSGRLPELGSASTEQHALMVSVMFELQHGDLRPFASRFRNRLVQDHLDTVLSIPLALNRLYICTPRQWLSSDEEARLERLNQDGDFSVLSIEGRGKDLFKLTHPHLSDAIYRALHPEAKPVTFARHLVSAFSHSLSSHLPTAVRLLRAASSNPSRLEIVDTEELARGMTEAWNAWDKFGLSRNMEAEMWVDWARWDASQPVVDTLLLVSPLETAIHLLDSEHPRWPQLWSRLWTCAPGEPTLVNSALGWLVLHFEVEGWYLVWRRVTGHAIQSSYIMNCGSETATRLCQFGTEWLKMSSHMIGWSRVWEQLVDAPDIISSPMHEEVIRAGVVWACKYREAPDWNFVWEKLATLSQQESSCVASNNIYELGFKWLNENANHPGWAFVWQCFMALPSLPISITQAELLQMAVTWSSGRENNPSWIFIAKTLAKEGNDEAKAKSLNSLVAWVEQSQNQYRWPISWFNLFREHRCSLTDDQCNRLFMAACEWVAADDERDHVDFMLTQILLNLHAFIGIFDEIGLLSKACDVLSRTLNMDNGEWTRLWFAVIKHLNTWPQDKSSILMDTLHSLGQRWIGEPRHLSDGAWSQIYRRVYRPDSVHEEIHRDLAIRGIVKGLIPDSAGFIALLYSTPTCGAPPDELLQWLDQWFGGTARGSGGFSVWLRLDRATSDALAQRPEDQWMKLRNILDLHRPDQASRWKMVVEHYRHRQPVVGRVMKTVLLKKWGDRPKRLGYVVDIGTNAFLSLEEAGIERGAESTRLAMVGQVFEFDIIRLDENRLQVDVSRQTLLKRHQQELVAALSIGTVVEGCVKSMQPYGVFVDIGFIVALLHISEMGEHPPRHPSDLFELGQHLIARVLAIDVSPSQCRVSLTIK